MQAFGISAGRAVSCQSCVCCLLMRLPGSGKGPAVENHDAVSVHHGRSGTFRIAVAVMFCVIVLSNRYIELRPNSFELMNLRQLQLEFLMEFATR